MSKSSKAKTAILNRNATKRQLNAARMLVRAARKEKQMGIFRRNLPALIADYANLPAAKPPMPHIELNGAGPVATAIATKFAQVEDGQKVTLALRRVEEEGFELTLGLERAWEPSVNYLRMERLLNEIKRESRTQKEEEVIRRLDNLLAEMRKK
jgi:hypothetical protein